MEAIIVCPLNASVDVMLTFETFPYRPNDYYLDQYPNHSRHDHCRSEDSDSQDCLDGQHRLQMLQPLYVLVFWLMVVMSII